jgi:hypothetical protein
MKMIKNILLLMLGSLCFFACSTEPEVEPEVPEIPEEPIAFMDTASLESVVLNLIKYIPTWEELERFTDTVERLPLPDYEKRASAWMGLPGEEDVFDSNWDWMPQVLEYNEMLTQRFGVNGSSALINMVPPFAMPDGSRIPVPYPLDVLDEKLRATACLFLYEKSLGLPVVLVNLYPPDMELDKFATREEFYVWFNNRFLPEKIAEAKAAELMKAEKYAAWPLEFEIFINEVGGVFDGGFLSNSSEEEVLAFAEEVKIKILTAVKTHYHGNVIAHLYNNYYKRPEYHYWDRMSYAGFDEINFAFFPPFDVETTNEYMDVQLEHYTRIIGNSGNIPWLASEVTVFEWYVEDGKLEAYEKDLYEAAFTKLEAAPIPHKGMAASGGYMKTEAARDFLADYFAQH